jgi:tape measure domain-containing protein
MARRPRTETVRRIVIFEAQTGSFEAALKNIDKASASAAKSLKRIDKATKDTAKGVQSLSAGMNKFSNLLKGFGVVYAAQQLFYMGRAAFDAGRALVDAGDALTMMQLRIERLGNGAARFDEVATLAYTLGITFADAADNVALLAPAFDRLNIPFGEVTKFAESLTYALRVYGTDARRAQIVTVQLTQALSSGQLQGDELRSLNENAGALGLSLERAVQGILGTTQSLKQLGTAGKLTTPVVLKGFEIAFKETGALAEQIPNLFQFQLARLENSWTRLLARLDERTKASETYTWLIGGMTEALDRFNQSLSAGMGDMSGYAAQLGDQELFKDVNEATAEVIRLKERLNGIDESSNPFLKGRIRIEVEKELNEQLRRQLALLDELAKRTKAQADVAIRAAQVGFLNPAQFDEAAASIAKALSLSDTGTENLKSFFPAIKAAAEAAQIPVERLIALIANESSFSNFGNSVSSATGPMQILEGTAKDLANQLSLSFEKIRDGSDGWESNILAGANLAAQGLKNAQNEIEGRAKYFLGLGASGDDLDYIPKGNRITGRQFAENWISTENKIREALGATDLAFSARADMIERAGKIEQQYASARKQFDNILRENLDLLDAGVLSQEAYVASIRDAADTFAKTDEAVLAMVKAEEERQEALQKGIEANDKLYTSLEALKESYIGLLANYDPLFAAQEEYSAAIAILNSAQTDLNRSTEEYDRVQALIAQRLAQTKDQILETSASVEGLGVRLKSTAFSAFDSWIDSATQGTFKLKDAMIDLTRQVVALVAKLLIFRAVSSAFGGTDFSGLFGLQANAMGNAFPGGVSLPQGIYNDPTIFKFAKGGSIGLLGEAGSEAILPLTRTSNGDLGVKSEPAQVNIVINNNARGVEVSSRQVDPATIELTVREIESRLQRGGNSTSRAFDSRYRR